MKSKKIFFEKKCDKTQDNNKIRVAAYCRVSTDTDDQRTSFDGQVRSYKEMIKKNKVFSTITAKV